MNKKILKLSLLLVCFLILQGQTLKESYGIQKLDVSLQNSNIEVFNLDNTKKIVLTFDDGPGRGTEQILNTLKKYNIKATFFALGQQIKEYPNLARRIVEEGHTLANHSYSHDRLSKDIYSKDNSLLMKELISTHDMIKKYVDPKINTFYFRAPYSAWTQGVSESLNMHPEIQKYIGPVCWDVGRNIEYDGDKIVNAGDWECWTKKANLNTKQCALGYYRKIQEIQGGVVLMHDIHLKTAEMVEQLIPALLAEGYQFIDLPQLQSLSAYKNFRSQIPRLDEKPKYSMYHGRCTHVRTPQPRSL